jgi:hypothetical protein
MSDWLTRYASALGAQLDEPDQELNVSEDLANGLLALARTIAEGTGDKTNAPLSSYLVGRYALAKAHEGLDAATAVDEATKVANELMQPGEG